ncbi:MAG: RNA 2',3'-cyclic phosphodiesterase [Bacteroidales bacterium]|nr:RNA 2',3'-cyclic phosphodiesterase [Bacteroidales bacterium]
MQNQYYRTFIGIPVGVGERVLEARKELRMSFENDRISWVDPARYHITIRFIGDVRISGIEQIGLALRKYVEIPRKTPVHLNRLSSFGPRKKPRVVWIGFEESTFFDLLKDGVDDALKSCSIPPDDQPFRAHITLGRIRSLKNMTGFYSSIEKMKDRFAERVFLDRLVLYRSELGSDGPVYTPLHTIEFRD